VVLAFTGVAVVVVFGVAVVVVIAQAAPAMATTASRASSFIRIGLSPFEIMCLILGYSRTFRARPARLDALTAR
jgi:hypothetical protein